MYNIDVWLIVISCTLALSVVTLHIMMFKSQRPLMIAYAISFIMLLIGYYNQLLGVLPFETARLLTRFGVLSLVSNVYAHYIPAVHYRVWRWITSWRKR